MAPPKGPKRIAAEEQLAAMRAQGISDDEIRQKLILSGLTKLQVNQIVGEPAKVPDKPLPPVTDFKREANIEGAVHFLETIAKRISPDAATRYTELSSVKHDALTWARKLKGVM